MTARTDRHRKSNGQGQGSKWITRPRRLAIYLRDGMACGYCGQGVEEGALLTLDHLMPHAEGGSDESGNLITACHTCNSARGKREYPAFAASVAAYLNHGVTAEAIVAHIQATVQRPVDTKAARALIKARGSWAQVMGR